MQFCDDLLYGLLWTSDHQLLNRGLNDSDGRVGYSPGGAIALNSFYRDPGSVPGQLLQISLSELYTFSICDGCAGLSPHLWHFYWFRLLLYLWWHRHGLFLEIVTFPG